MMKESADDSNRQIYRGPVVGYATGPRCRLPPKLALVVFIMYGIYMAYKNKDDAKRWYADHKETELVRSKENKARYQARNIQFVQEYKLANPCVDCKNYFLEPEVLEFDHIGSDKTLHVSTMCYRPMSLDRIKKEIQKCELVCANCHRVRTASRKRHIGVV